MRKDKKVPKKNPNDYVLSTDAEAILYGLILILVSLIGILAKGVVGEAITYVFAYIFGIFYILIYLLLIFFGLYLMIKKEMIKIKVDVKILGAILLTLGFCIAGSNSTNLTVQNFFNEYYQPRVAEVSPSIFRITSTQDIFSSLGGGFIGFFLAGALNSALTNVGTTIVVVVFILVGFILLLKDYIVRLYKFFKNYHAKRKALRNEAHIERREEEYHEEDRTLPVIENPQENINNQTKTNSDNSSISVDDLFINREKPSSILNQLEEEKKQDVQVNETSSSNSSNLDLDYFFSSHNINTNKENIDEPKVEQITKEESKPIDDISPLDEMFNDDSVVEPSFSENIQVNENQTSDNEYTLNNEIPSVTVSNDYSIENSQPVMESEEENTNENVDLNNNQVEEQVFIPTPIKVEMVQESVNSILPSKQEPHYVEPAPTKVILQEEIKEEVKEVTPSIEEEMKNYIYPPISLLKDRINADESYRKMEQANDRAKKINECFSDLGVGASVISYTIGPSVTRFDVKVNANVKTNVLIPIQNDLAVRLGGNKTLRLETIVEGKNTSGIELGNDICDIVSFKECMNSMSSNTKDKLLFPLGKDVDGKIVQCKLNETPHLLVSGTTGSGKSVFIHNIIVSLIMRNKPNELKLLLIDPKKVEFTKYADLPHLLCPIVTSTEEGKVALSKLVDEMERRFDTFAKYGKGASNLEEYYETCDEEGYEKPPYIVAVIDEFADFMSEGDKEVGKNVQRIAQKARACGIHMVIATQRPSVKVITGEIKTNIPSRIALSVSSFVDSKIIIDEGGAENLLGRGDLLARIPSKKSLVRAQSAYIDNKEIYGICEFIRKQAHFVCDPNFADLSGRVQNPLQGAGIDMSGNGPYRDYHMDEKYEEIKNFVIQTGYCSATKLQTHFGIGFSKADGILDTLQQDGIIRREGNKRVLADKYAARLGEGNNE